MLVAITGGIGTGKTTVCKKLEELGYTVFYSDDIAKKLVFTNTELKTEIIKHFGEISFINGIYNTSYISDIVFINNEKLILLNSIFEPFITAEIIKMKSDKLVFYESALIFEHNKSSLFDYTICCYIDKEIIIQRLKHRNNYSDDEIKKRLDSQMDSYTKTCKSDFIIETNDNIDDNIQHVITKL